MLRYTFRLYVFFSLSAYITINHCLAIITLIYISNRSNKYIVYRMTSRANGELHDKRSNRAISNSFYLSLWIVKKEFVVVLKSQRGKKGMFYEDRNIQFERAIQSNWETMPYTRWRLVHFARKNSETYSSAKFQGTTDFSSLPTLTSFILDACVFVSRQTYAHIRAI